MKTCKDCIHYDVCGFHITEETDMSVEECAHGFKDKEQYRKQEWISVEERLPERTGKYLVFTYNRRLYIGVFIDHYCDGIAQFDDYKVTHWMPLPEAPKMKGGAE